MKSPKKTAAKPAMPPTSSIRFRAEDWAVIEALQKKTGVSSVTELVRLALRALAAKEGMRS